MRVMLLRQCGHAEDSTSRVTTRGIPHPRAQNEGFHIFIVSDAGRLGHEVRNWQWQ